MPKYPKVDHSHIVPRAWLRTFADEHGMIGMRLLDDPDWDEPVPIKHAAVRSKAYSRTRPHDGTRIDDVEWSLSQLENKAAPVLQTVEERWPLKFEEKLLLAELFGAQLVRGNRWREGYEARSDRLVDHYQHRGDFDQDATGEHTVEAIAETHRDWFRSNTFRLKRMLYMVPKACTVCGSMIWSLITFPRPVLVTADHPVTGWSRWETSRRPKTTPDGLGLINCMEIRVPVSPTAAIVMAWLDRSEDITEPFDGTRQQARNLNSFTIAQAKKQWFHLPGTRPSFSMRRSYSALAMELFPGYGPEAVEASVLRRAVHDKVNSRLGEETNEFEIIRLNPAA